MSSMRNAVQRRPHRERAQPLERRRLGLLEKHKDYSLRAKDYNKKQEHLKKLREKASERNEDEFYFGMLSRNGPGNRTTDGKKWRGTVDGDRGTKAMDMDTARLLKTQDIGYIRTMKQVVRKEVARLEQQVVLTREVNGLPDKGHWDDLDEDLQAPKKIVFLDDEDERDAMIDDQIEGAEEEEVDNDDDDEDGNKEETEAERSLRRLKRALKNEKLKLKALTRAEQELDKQRGSMEKKGPTVLTRRGKKVAVRTRKR